MGIIKLYKGPWFQLGNINPNNLEGLLERGIGKTLWLYVVDEYVVGDPFVEWGSSNFSSGFLQVRTYCGIMKRAVVFI